MEDVNQKHGLKKYFKTWNNDQIMSAYDDATCKLRNSRTCIELFDQRSLI